MEAFKPDLARVARMGDSPTRASLQAKRHDLTALIAIIAAAISLIFAAIGLLSPLFIGSDDMM